MRFNEQNVALSPMEKNTFSESSGFWFIKRLKTFYFFPLFQEKMGMWKGIVIAMKITTAKKKREIK